MQHKINLLPEEKSDSGWYAAIDSFEVELRFKVEPQVG